MNKEPNIKYEPHPVSPERKAELRARGYKIVDLRFAPAGYGASAKAGSHAGLANGGINDGLDELDIDELRTLAQERGVNVHHNAGADKIRLALRDAQWTSGGQE